MSVEQNKTLCQRFFTEVCNERKPEVAQEIFSADHRYHDPFIPNVAPGPGGMNQVIATYQTAFHDAQWMVDEMFTAEGDRVITRWVGQGTHTAELAGLAPTGKHVSVSGIWIHQIAEGKIVASWNVWDAAGLLRQLDVIPS